MKYPTFFQGVAVALGASLSGSILSAALTPMFTGAVVLRLLIVGLGFSYIVYLLSHSRVRVGRVSVTALWVLLAGINGFLDPPLSLYLLVHLVAIWLIRSLYFYSSLLCGLADLVLNILSLSAAIWAFSHTSSLFLSIWSFFLMQALFVVIPARISGKPGGSDPQPGHEDRFARAHRTAQAAVRKLSLIN